MKSILALDFGGTKLAAGLVDHQTGQVLKLTSCPTLQDSQKSLAAIHQIIKQILDRPDHESITGIGVSFGGPVEGDGRTIRISHHVPGWEHFPLADRLETIFQVPVRIANDADAAALGEYHYGAGRGIHNMLYLTVSTGIGGGIIINGKIYHGEHSWAGEIGHMILLPDGPECPCGRRGCLESLSSGRSIAQRMRQRLSEHPVEAVNLDKITAKTVADAARSGDRIAIEVWDDAMHWLAIGIANAANLLNPGIIVIGGGLIHSGDLLFTPISSLVKSYSIDPNLRITPAALKDSAGLLGAAALFLN